jgi:asparagine synthase (glutamine-hydrolysing)
VSALAGCYWFETPARANDLRASTDCAVHRAGGPFRFWSCGPVALAFADACSPASPSPFHDPVRRMTVVVDGRIDNLDEIASQIGEPKDSTIPSVVMSAFRHWGLDTGVRLLGDFALVVYDEAERRVTCIRDPMGQRPLFYGTGTRGIVFGSEANQVVRHPAIRSDFNDAMIAEHLSDAPTTIHETLWRNVHRLPAAHALEITVSGARVRRYWDFDPDACVRHARAEEYDEEFRDLFVTAVQCRIRDARRPGVFLSGGIDSSSVAGVAHAILARAGAPPIHTFSLTFPGRSCDETTYSDAVVQAWRLNATRIDAAPTSREDVLAEARRYLDLPAYPNGLMMDALRKRAKATGVDVLLTGCGGDDFFSGSVTTPMSLLRRGRAVSAVRALVSPWLSDRARRALKPIVGARPVQRPWIRSEFARSVGLEDRLRPRPDMRFRDRERRELHNLATGLPQVLGDEAEDRAAHATGLDQRHPFYDRRVAQLGLALPSPERSHRGQIKVLVRRALRAYLPPLVADRNGKAEFSSTFVDALEALGGRRAFAKLESERAGWVDRDAVLRTYDEMIALYSRGSEAYIRLTGPLWAVAALEIWLEAARSSSTMGATGDRST